MQPSPQRYPFKHAERKQPEIIANNGLNINILSIPVIT